MPRPYSAFPTFNPNHTATRPAAKRAEGVEPRLAGVPLLEQAIGVERERGERRVGAEEPGHDGGAHPGLLEAGLERLHREPDQERPGDVDDEDAPRKRPRPPPDQLVEAVARQGAERSCDGDSDYDGHPLEDMGRACRSGPPASEAVLTTP